MISMKKQAPDYYRADLNPDILLLEKKYVAVYTQGKVFCFPSIQT